MTINTKFDIGNIVFLINENKMIECIIKSFKIDSFDGNINYPIEEKIFYGLKDVRGWDISAGDTKFSEFRLFKTKEELLKSL